jgi:putative redox protein
MDLMSIEQIQDMAFSVQIRNHEMISDMPPEEGGKDLGLRPAELVVGALGACIGMSIARYCQTLDCSTEGLAIYLTYQMADDPKRVKSIVADVELPDAFPENRKEALRRVIEACSVHGTLKTIPDIDIAFD